MDVVYYILSFTPLSEQQQLNNTWHNPHTPRARFEWAAKRIQLPTITDGRCVVSACRLHKQVLFDLVEDNIIVLANYCGLHCREYV